MHGLGQQIQPPAAAVGKIHHLRITARLRPHQRKLRRHAQIHARRSRLPRRSRNALHIANHITRNRIALQ